MKRLSSERGAVPVLILALMVILVAVVGVAVYNVSKPRQKSAATASTSPSPSASLLASASPTSAQAVGKMLVIKELGVEIPLDNAPSDLQYQMVTMSGQTVAAIDTSQLNTASHCSAGRLGFITKTSGVVPDGIAPYHATDESGSQLNYLLKQLNGFYIQHVPAQNACDLPNGGIYPDKATLLEVVRAVDNLQPVQ